MKVVLRRRGRVTYSLDMLSHARGVQIQWWEKCLSLTRPQTPGAVAARGAVRVRPSVTAVKREESLFHHSTFRKTPRRVPRERATHALACGALLRLKTSERDARKGTSARDQTDGPRRALLRQRPPALTQKSSTPFTFLSSTTSYDEFPPRIQFTPP